jgi:GT2 family glycosyltransferase
MAILRVAVIVLNYRGENVLQACLTSLHRSLGPEDRLLVVDNGGEGVLLERMQTLLSELEVVSLGTNGGFAAGMNFGIRHMQAAGGFDAYWIVNNDATVMPETLSELKNAFIERGPKALFSPIILTEPEREIWFSGGRLDFFRMRTVHDRKPISTTPYETGFLTGCALFIPEAAIAALGHLDERYFLYYEDAEYSLRARRGGLPLFVVPKAIACHAEQSESSPEKTYWLVRSGAEFFLRESRGIWKLWVPCYLAVRRLKNRLEIRWSASSRVASEVKRAYTDVSL